MTIDLNAGTIEYMIVTSTGMIASTIASVTATVVGIAGSIENSDGITATTMIGDSVMTDVVFTDAGEETYRLIRNPRASPFGLVSFVLKSPTDEFTAWAVNYCRAILSHP